MYKEHSHEYIPHINTYLYGDVLMSNFYYKSLEILKTASLIQTSNNYLISKVLEPSSKKVSSLGRVLNSVVQVITDTICPGYITWRWTKFLTKLFYN